MAGNAASGTERIAALSEAHRARMRATHQAALAGYGRTPAQVRMPEVRTIPARRLRPSLASRGVLSGCSLTPLSRCFRPSFRSGLAKRQRERWCIRPIPAAVEIELVEPNRAKCRLALAEKEGEGVGRRDEQVC